MKIPKIAVILASTRSGRQGEKVARWFMNAVKDNKSAEIELVDLKDYTLPFLEDATHPMMRGETHENPEVDKWLKKMAEADGYIIVTPEYNASFPAVLKNALDYGYKEWGGKYVAFVSYGAHSGGIRAVEHLRAVITNLEMFGINDKIAIPQVWNAFDEEGNLAHGESLAKTANTMIEKIASLAKRK